MVTNQNYCDTKSCLLLNHLVNADKLNKENTCQHCSKYKDARVFNGLCTLGGRLGLVSQFCEAATSSLTLNSFYTRVWQKGSWGIGIKRYVYFDVQKLKSMWFFIIVLHKLLKDSMCASCILHQNKLIFQLQFLWIFLKDSCTESSYSHC